MGNVDAIISLLSNFPDAFYTLQDKSVTSDELEHDFSSNLKKGKMRKIESTDEWEFSFYCSSKTHKRYGFEELSDFRHSLMTIFQLQLQDATIPEGPNKLNVFLYNERTGLKLSKKLVRKNQPNPQNIIRIDFIFSDFFNDGNNDEYRRDVFDKISSSSDLLVSLCPQFNSELHSRNQKIAPDNSSIYMVHDYSNLGSDFVFLLERLFLNLLHQDTITNTLLDVSKSDKKRLFEKEVVQFFSEGSTAASSLPEWITEAVLSNICVNVASEFKQFRTEFADKIGSTKIRDNSWQVKPRPNAKEFGCCYDDDSDNLESPCWKFRGAFQQRTSKRGWKKKFSELYNTNFDHHDNNHHQNLYGVTVGEKAGPLKNLDFDKAYEELENYYVESNACDCNCHVYAKNPGTWRHLHIYDSNISEAEKFMFDHDFIPFGLRENLERFGDGLIEKHRKNIRKKSGISINAVVTR